MNSPGLNLQKNPDVRPYVSLNRDRLDVEKVVAWTIGAYWGNGKTPEQIRQSIKNSMVFGLYALERGNPRPEQIGFARVISDHWTASAITDLFVVPEYRGRGFGRALMQAVIEHPSIARTICILGTRDAAGFYRKFGFRDAFSHIMQRDPTP